MSTERHSLFIQTKEQKRLYLSPIPPSPCTVECPLDTNVKAYVSLIAAGKFEQALAVVRQTNPFPGICGRVCPHPCESMCRRKEIDEPVAITALKRFLADYELRRGVIPKMVKTGNDQGRVAVVGAGPAGLTCGADLARLGYEVNVFEALSIPGGMMVAGIPAYRLPREIVRVEIEAIEALGVNIVLNTRIGDELTLKDLGKDHDAVFIAPGAQASRRLDIPGAGEITEGMIDWVTFLRDAALGAGKYPGSRVVVVGGGNTAVDSARTALRLGAKQVRILYRRSRLEMPAFEDEIVDAEEEGIGIEFLSAPKRLVHDHGRLTGVECIRMKPGAAEANGRPGPVPIDGSEFLISCDAFIPAIGQEPETAVLAGKGITLSEGNLIEVDPLTLMTSLRGVFAGGDAVTGPASVLEAIAAGHRAARSIQCYVRGTPLQESHMNRLAREMTTDLLPEARSSRTRFMRLPASERCSSFAEVNQVYTPFQAAAEAQRCLRCGPCSECVSCTGVCGNKQIILEPASLSRDQRLSGEIQLVRVAPETGEMLEEEGISRALYRGQPHHVSVFTVRIDPLLCRGCGECEEVCAYHAIRTAYRGGGVFTAEVDRNMCRGCGSCIPVCPTGAIDQNFFSSGRIRDRVREEAVKGAVAFSCHWNRAAQSRCQFPPHGLIRVMCIGRIEIGDVLHAFEWGARGVLFMGCPETGCHYGFDCCRAEEIVEQLVACLELFGLERERLELIHFDEGSEEALGDFFSKLGKLSPITEGG